MYNLYYTFSSIAIELLLQDGQRKLCGFFGRDRTTEGLDGGRGGRGVLEFSKWRKSCLKQMFFVVVFFS